MTTTLRQLENSFEKLRNLILVEEFKRCIPNNIKTFVDEKKVEELAQSIRDLGRLINPISIDEKNNLIAGNHRLSAHKLLEIEEIPAIVFSADDLMSKLMEIDENLYTNPLCFISQSESIQQREIILQSLGKRTQRGDNRFTEKEKITG